MTKTQRAKLIALAESAANLEAIHRNMGFQNVPRDPEQAAEQSARYTLAGAEAYEARGKVQAFIAKLAPEAHPEVRALADVLLSAAQGHKTCSAETVRDPVILAQAMFNGSTSGLMGSLHRLY